MKANNDKQFLCNIIRFLTNEIYETKDNIVSLDILIKCERAKLNKTNVSHAILWDLRFQRNVAISKKRTLNIMLKDYQKRLSHNFK